MSSPNLNPLRSFLHDRRKRTVAGLLAAVLLLGAFLRFHGLGASGVGNAYYAATVKSMLTSWHNFFYVAFEPGGSVSVDKPPLGFWLEALSAYFLGVTGYALALPNAIAGVLSIAVMFALIRRPFGDWAGLLAGLALAVMPVAVSAERNNTIDGMLVCVLLLAAWAFLRAVYTSRVRWLFVGAALVGVGFNIKMLQAFLPLPAFFAVYFFGVKRTWWKKLLDLAAATILLLAISFSWALAVDLTPASQRPYVDSTSNNSVMELIFGHNGLERLTRIRSGLGLDGQLPGSPVNPGLPQGQFPQGQLPAGGRPQPPSGSGLPGQRPNTLPQTQPPSGQPGNPGGAGGSMDFGTAGTLRLFTQPLVGEASWLLPFVLAGLAAIGLALWKTPFGERHVALVLWAGWLLPETLYFTYSQGLMHAYYLIMMGAPLAALTAATAWALAGLVKKKRRLAWSLGLVLVAGTLAFQAGILRGTTDYAVPALITALTLAGAGALLAFISLFRVRLAPYALALWMLSLLVAPALWSALTTFNSSPNGALPAAGPSGATASFGPGNAGDGNWQGNDPGMVAYLLANTQPGTYLLAVDGASQAAPLILETGRPVFTFGGFLGTDNIVDAAGLAKLVASGKLRFVLDSGQLSRSYPSLATWLQSNCKTVDLTTIPAEPAGYGGGQGTILYDCGG